MTVFVHKNTRRGAAGLVIIIVLVILQLVVVSVVLAGARDQDMMLKRLDSVRAFYASEGGMNMAIREMMNGTDEDGDGTVGSISNDGNAANNPVVGFGTTYVTASTSSGITTLTSRGLSGSAKRNIVTNFGAASAKNADGQQIASKGTLASPATLTTITALVNGPPPKLLRYALYSDSAGGPSARMAETTNVPVGNNTLFWLTLPLATTSLPVGDYWVALGFEHSNMYYSFNGHGTTKFNANDAILNGFSNPWGATTQTTARQMNMFATVMQDTVGPMTFGADSDYQNNDPPVAGRFRDITAAAYIQRGNDLGSGSYTALNFTAAGGITVANAYTVYDTDPTTAAPTNFTGSIRVSADMLFTNGGGGIRYMGLAALHNELAGQEGLAVLMRENGANDRLDLCRLPQNGDVSGAPTLSTSSTFNGIAVNTWYRLIVDITIFDGDVNVDGRLYSHATSTDPSSALNVAPIANVTHHAAMGSLVGLNTSGEVAVIFDGTSNPHRGSVTNLAIYSNPVMLPSLTNYKSVSGWAEAP